MSRWRPSPGEERWLEVAARLGGAAPRDAVAGRAGGWRSTGVVARIALFVLGLLAAALMCGILGFNDGTMLLVAGLISAAAAEWLTVSKRLHASGIEEGLCVGGFLLIGWWVAARIAPSLGHPEYETARIVLIMAAGAAGLRLLNPFVTSCAAIAFVNWLGSTGTARGLDLAAGNGITELAVGWTLAALALVLGLREFRRPSYDRMLDWLVVTLPVAAYVQHAAWSVVITSGVVPGAAGAGRLATAIVLLGLAIAMLVAGVRRRRHSPLLGFMVCVACLLMELRIVTALATETWLILCGLAALVAGVTLDRYLRQPRGGVTSARLSDREGPLDLLQTAGATVLAGRASPVAPAAERALTPSEGRFGGGGASGSY